MIKTNINPNTSILLWIIPMLLVVLVYYQLPHLDFAYVDDRWMLLDESLIQATWSWDTLCGIFTRVNNLQYSPLNTFYYYLIYQIDGYNPYYYHLGSLCLHLINGIVVYKLLVKLFMVFSLGHERTYAYIIMLIWLIHPFNVESVVWVSASKIPLFSAFYLLSLYCFIQAYQKTKYYKLSYILSLFFFILSFMSKEQAVTLPAVILTFVLLIQSKNKSVDLKKAGLKLLPFVVLSFVFIYVTLFSLHFEGGSHPFDTYPVAKRLFFTFYSLGFYIFNSFLPVELHYHYPFPIKPDENVPLIFYIISISLVFSLFLLHAVLKSTKEYYLYLFLFIFFIVNLSLCIHIVSLPRASIVADRYMYLPLFSVISIAVIYVGKRLESGSFKQPFHPYALWSVGIFATVCLVIYSHNLVLDWKSRQLVNYESKP